MSILKENIFFGFFHEDLVAHSGVVPGLISKIARKLHGTRGCGTAGKLQVPSSWHHDRHVGNFSAKTCMIRGPNDFQEWPPEMPWKWWKGHDVFSKKKATFFNPPFFFATEGVFDFVPYKRVVIQRSHPGLRSFKIWMPWRTTETPGIVSGWKNGKV